MKEFYAEECGVLCWQEQTRQSVTKELLEEILGSEIIKFEIDFERKIIEYKSIHFDEEFTGEITINNFFKICYESQELTEICVNIEYNTEFVKDYNESK